MLIYRYMASILFAAICSVFVVVFAERIWYVEDPNNIKCVIMKGVIVTDGPTTNAYGTHNFENAKVSRSKSVCGNRNQIITLVSKANVKYDLDLSLKFVFVRKNGGEIRMFTIGLQYDLLIGGHQYMSLPETSSYLSELKFNGNSLRIDQSRTIKIYDANVTLKDLQIDVFRDEKDSKFRNSRSDIILTDPTNVNETVAMVTSSCSKPFANFISIFLLVLTYVASEIVLA